jgi:hypothetical protein
MPNIGRARNCVLWAGLLDTTQIYTYNLSPTAALGWGFFFSPSIHRSLSPSLIFFRGRFFPGAAGDISWRPHPSSSQRPSCISGAPPARCPVAQLAAFSLPGRRQAPCARPISPRSAPARQPRHLLAPCASACFLAASSAPSSPAPAKSLHRGAPARFSPWRRIPCKLAQVARSVLPAHAGPSLADRAGFLLPGRRATQLPALLAARAPLCCRISGPARTPAPTFVAGRPVFPAPGLQLA